MHDERHKKFRDNILPVTLQKLKNALSDYFSQAPKSAAVAVYSVSGKPDDTTKQLKEKFVSKKFLKVESCKKGS